jgi:hypothetical protein
LILGSPAASAPAGGSLTMSEGRGLKKVDGILFGRGQLLPKRKQLRPGAWRASTLFPVIFTPVLS